MLTSRDNAMLQSVQRPATVAKDILELALIVGRLDSIHARDLASLDLMAVGRLASILRTQSADLSRIGSRWTERPQ